MTGAISEGGRQLPDLALRPERRLMRLDQIADALRVGFAVPVARDGIGSAGGLDANVRPDHAGRDVNGSDLRDGNALFIAAEQSRLHSSHRLRADDESGGEKEVVLRPAAGLKGLGLGAGSGTGWDCAHEAMVRRRKAASTGTDSLRTRETIPTTPRFAHQKPAVAYLLDSL